MKMKGTGSFENLYPPSYGSRASSSLSLGSSGAYHRSFSSNIARPHPESPNMYSSLPIVFHSTSHDGRAKLNAISPSEEKIVPFDDWNNQLLSNRQPGNGSHFYTPSRRKKQTERKLKIQDQKNQAPEDTFFRSSSDGKANEISSALANTHTIQLDDMPPLVPSFETALAFDDSNSEVSLTPGGTPGGTPRGSERDASRLCETSFEYSELVVSAAKTDDGEDFDFPSPPPIPPQVDSPEQEIETPATTASTESYQYEKSAEASTFMETVPTEAVESAELCEADRVANSEEPSSPQEHSQLGETDCIRVGTQDPVDSKADEANLSAEELDTAKINTVEEPSESTAINDIYRGSVGKLSKMLGPEFNTLSGFHAGEKKVKYSKVPVVW